MSIHPTSVVSGDVQIADDVEIGPYCFIQGQVKIGSGTRVEAHVTLGSRYGVLDIGKNNVFYPGSVIGGPPQDVTYVDSPTRLRIGDHNVFREFTTVNLATTKADGETTIGDHNYFMTCTHIGHDCKIGNHVIIANDTHLGGHTMIEDSVTIGGVCAFNQFVRVGKNAFIAGSSGVNKDILPFTKAQGNYAVSRVTNKIGLERKGYTKKEIENIHRAIRILLVGEKIQENAVNRILQECENDAHIEYLLTFIRNSHRGIAR